MAHAIPSSSLPRLLYFSDVPLEPTMFQGAGLVYRLLEDYPTDRLLAVESKPVRAAVSRRLPGVAYRELKITGNRWRYSRFSRWANSWLLLDVYRGARDLSYAVEGFAPQAVLTLTCGYTWLVAARFAESERLPLHLILHDDWPPSMRVLSTMRSRQDSAFATAYRYASSRFCVSPFMEEEYRRDYGSAGEVLYPSWAKDIPTFDMSPRAYRDHTEPLVGAYAGNIFRPGYTELIAKLAERLEARGGRLLLFGPHTPGQLTDCGLDRPNVIPHGVVSPEEMASRVRAEADFVFVPMSFGSDALQRNMRISFPSKLTDCTMAGLPLLICGPEYCSAVRWAQQHPGVAEVLTSESTEQVDAALARLENARHRERLGRAVRELGEKLFSHPVSMEIFRGALRRTSGMEHPAERVPSRCIRQDNFSKRLSS